MEQSMLVRGSKRDSKPLLLKLGFALAISLATYFASYFTLKPKISPPKSSSGGNGLKNASVKSSSKVAHGFKDELHILSNEEALAKIINGTSGPTTKSIAHVNEETEINKIVMQEFEAFIQKNEVETVKVDKEREEMEKEIAYLKNLIESLKERERTLESQLIEYYDLKEQNASLRELENRLKVNVMEHKLLTLRIEALQADNQKLKAQVSDYPKLVSEVETSREEIKLLKNKLKVDGEQAKEKLALLHVRITEMINRERNVGEDEIEDEKKLKRLKELENEVIDLRKVNSRLADENLKFSEMVESMKMEASLAANHHEVEALKITNNLREENENLKKEIEQLQTDRCTDVEELVYLRWVNACLRYELRNYQPPQGKTVARDLGKCLSPESEKKAKKLIIDYAKSDTDSKNISLFDFDVESCSSSQTSSDDFSEISFDISSSTKSSKSRKSKVVSKLKKLVLGKKNNHKGDSFEETNEKRNSYDSVSSCISLENVSGNDLRSSRSSLDVQRIKRFDMEVNDSIANRSKSDLGISRSHMRVISEDCLSDFTQYVDNEDEDDPEKVKLKKFADVLKGSVKSKRRFTSFS